MAHNDFSDDEEFYSCQEVCGEFACCENLKRSRLIQEYNTTHLGVLEQEA